LRDECIDRIHIVGGCEVGVAGERFAFFSIDQNLHAQDSRNVFGECANQGGDAEFLFEYAGAVSVGERRIQVDNGEICIDKINGAKLGARGDWMG
jgi:hypothetical protein